MKEEDIKKFIEIMNAGRNEETIFLRKINNNVEFAKVWEKEPELDDNPGCEIPSYKFFFIKNDNGKYIGAVLDMNRDLHWYILEGFRKNGYLTRSLREAILPYLFYDEFGERNEQRITINKENIGKRNYINSKKVAMNRIHPSNDVFSRMILATTFAKKTHETQRIFKSAHA